MALSVMAGTFVFPQTAQTQPITGLSFTPKVILFQSGGAQSSTSGGIQHGLGFGIVNNEASVSYINSDTVASSAASMGLSAGKCIIIGDTAETADFEADLLSTDSGGFTLDWTTASAFVRGANYLALGGDDLTGFFVGTFNSPSATGTQIITGLAFQPEALLFLGSIGSTGTGYVVNGRLTFSAAVAASNEWTSNFVSADAAAAGDEQSNQVSNKICQYISAALAINAEANLVSMDSGGFTLSWTTAAARKFIYLALAGGQYAIGTYNQPSATGTQSIIGLPFQPNALISFSDGKVAHTSPNVNTNYYTGSVTSSGNVGSRSMSAINAADPTQTNKYDSGSKFIAHITAGTPIVDSEADFDTFDSGGFTIDWTTADATARNMLYLAFGSDAVAGDVTCTPAAAVISIVVPAVTALITHPLIVTTPAVAVVSVVVPSVTAVISSGGSVVTTPSAAVISVVVPQPTLSIVGGNIVTTPSAAVIQIVVPQPTVVISSANTLTVTTEAAKISLVFPDVTTLVTKPLITTQAGVAVISIVVPQATMSVGVAGGIILTIYMKSQINKYVYRQSKINKFVYRQSKINKFVQMESSIIND